MPLRVHTLARSGHPAEYPVPKAICSATYFTAGV